MEANELRIGNWVLDIDNDFLSISEITKYYVSFNHFNLKNRYSEIKPIPLTEEWLLNFGFKQNKYDKVFEIENCQIEIYFFDNDIKCTVCVDSVINKNIKHVHQLQNLYFALTGQELKLIH